MVRNKYQFPNYIWVTGDANATCQIDITFDLLFDIVICYLQFYCNLN